MTRTHPLPTSISSSAQNNMFHAWIIHKAPHHLSKADFEAKMEALVDRAALLPIVQKNLVKLEMIFQNDAADDHIGAYGFPPKEPVVFDVLHSETPEQIYEIFAAAEVRELFAEGREWGLQSISSGFSASLDIKVDNPAPKDGAHLFVVYHVPPTLSSEEHDKRCHEFVESFVEIPACRKHLVRFEEWQSNNLLDNHMEAFGYSAAGPTFCESYEI
ncbi:hypothetical protein MSAN_02015500 [Mycena sanguinolenta]|uniref:Uncharacterized protein n=1 Tax=Mycena sanguinolenta TaxID=230812 RepID=A0A8H6XJA1_9AGAR|nr:hypothetical protein MSAN_02015500 [Mycena sanguinolenta]